MLLAISAFSNTTSRPPSKSSTSFCRCARLCAGSGGRSAASRRLPGRYSSPAILSACKRSVAAKQKKSSAAAPRPKLLQKQAELLAEKRSRRVYIERVIHRRFSALDLLPFGIPQLVARRRAVGAVLLVGEALSGGGSLGTLVGRAVAVSRRQGPGAAAQDGPGP